MNKDAVKEKVLKPAKGIPMLLLDLVMLLASIAAIVLAILLLEDKTALGVVLPVSYTHLS